MATFVCRNCGNPKLAESDRICLACGTVLLKPSAPAAPGANFSETLNHIKSGGKAYREIWCKYYDTKEQEWIGVWKPGNPAFEYFNSTNTISKPKSDTIFRWSSSNRSLVLGWGPSSEDVLADDWVLV